MSYRLTVPFVLLSENFEAEFEANLQRCRDAGAHRIFYVVCDANAPQETKQRTLALLRTYLPRVKAAGFEVGCWFNSLGHGGPAGARTQQAAAAGDLTLMRSLDGSADGENYCPLNERFRRQFCDWMQQLAAAGAQILQLDDDFRYGWRGGKRYCCCEEHIRLLEAELGEPFDAARMQRALTEGGPNRWRDAWLKVQGETLLDFARMLRTAVDEVNPTVRLTACACLSTWDTDGVDAPTLAKAFAGGTKPLLRLIGAPYWAGLRNYEEAGLAVVCEYERLQLHWTAGSGVETMTEGDSHPNDRYCVPAAYAENFDRVLRAAGEGDGILKYMYYGEGYHPLHLRSRSLHTAIHAAFDGKKAVGLQVYEPMKTLALAHDPGEAENRCIPAALRFVTDNSLPVRYDAGGDAAVIFGDAAEYAGEEQFKNGAILDAAAARILTRRGFDVGVTAASEPFFPGLEKFLDLGCTDGIYGAGSHRRLCAAPGAEALSLLYAGTDTAPGALRYENAKGQRFLIFAFEARQSLHKGVERGRMRSRNRALQVRSQLAWLARRTPDAICDPAPDLYMLVKKAENSLTVGLWNFSVDEVDAPTVHLGADWDTLIARKGAAVLNGRTVTLEPLPAFGCAFFTLHKEP